MTMSTIGSTVHVWPRPGLRVQEFADIPGRFLPAGGKACTWTPWLQRRLGTGEISLTNPLPLPLPHPAPPATSHTAPAPPATSDAWVEPYVPSKKKE